MSCALCASVLETPVLRESRHWRTALNRNQNLLGKTIVVLRRHEEDVAALTRSEWAELQSELGAVTSGLRAAFRPDHFNYAFLQNQDRHVHLHVIPRYATARSVGEAVFDDPSYPDHYRPGEERRLDAEVLDEIAAVVRAADGA
jgi:diadenosine tetraphosphate (Ap4A) HIT family hydrolase